jgi:tetratricopeptide (TPR) repeat protein
VYRAWEEWAAALEAYDAAIALSPDHPEAMIGRTISLSRLGRPDEAIETASQVIDGGEWRRGEAFYWRGWNHLVRGDYQAAWSDADERALRDFEARREEAVRLIDVLQKRTRARGPRDAAGPPEDPRARGHSGDASGSAR